MYIRPGLFIKRMGLLDIRNSTQHSALSTQCSTRENS
jgi:hypothetical protein